MNMMKDAFNLHIIGDKNEKKVLLIHGVGFYWETCFEKLIKQLEDHCCIIVPELEGHCKQPSSVMTSVMNTADKIVEELKNAGIKTIDLVYGISLGASIALEICLKKQIELKCMLLDSGQYESMGEMTQQFSEIMTQQFLGILKGEHLMSPVKENMGYFRNQDIEVLQPLIYPEINENVLYHAFMSAYSYDIQEREEHIDIKTLIMLGGNELYAKRSIQLIEAKCLLKLQVLEFPEKGHAEVLSLEPEKIGNVILKEILK